MNQVSPPSKSPIPTHPLHNRRLIEGKTGFWEVTIGLEVHAHIASHSKLFSCSATHFGAEPNEHVSFVDAGMPGMLPTINGQCVDQAIKTGLGINGTINLTSIFDRKNYFYPDLPTGYQITQFYLPIVSGGHIDIEIEEGTVKRIRINRLHIEQDAGKSIHDLHPLKTYVDLNRAGIGLMEIVSEPDLRSAHEAVMYVKKLRSLLRYLGSCDGNMEQGNLRVDANISLRRPGDDLGTRAEIKNVNSFRFLSQSIDYEIERQLNILESGGSVVQETRLYDPQKGVTRSMRSKEQAHDYRYFPDPDLPLLKLSPERVARIKQELPELPDEKKERFIRQWGLPPYDATILVSEQEIAAFYERVVHSCQAKDTHHKAKLCANWLIGEVFASMHKEGKAIDGISLKPEHLAELIDLIISSVISSKIAKDVFAKMWETGASPRALVEELGLTQISDTGTIEKAIDDVLIKEALKVEEYRGGKVQLFPYFIGQVMKATQGKANPGLVNELLQKKLSGY